jgi:hypothetical protein
MVQTKKSRISEAQDAQIRALISEDLSDLEIARRAKVSAPTVASRRPPRSALDAESAIPLVIGALRHLAASEGLTEAELSDRLGIPCNRLIISLITLGVVRRSTGEPPRYGLRKDWL